MFTVMAPDIWVSFTLLRQHNTKWYRNTHIFFSTTSSSTFVILLLPNPIILAVQKVAWYLVFSIWMFRFSTQTLASCTTSVASPEGEFYQLTTENMGAASYEQTMWFSLKIRMKCCFPKPPRFSLYVIIGFKNHLLALWLFFNQDLKDWLLLSVFFAEVSSLTQLILKL